MVAKLDTEVISADYEAVHYRWEDNDLDFDRHSYFAEGESMVLTAVGVGRDA